MNGAEDLFPTGCFFPVAFFSKTETVVTGYHNDGIGQECRLLFFQVGHDPAYLCINK